jgi:hypothetical protein
MRRMGQYVRVGGTIRTTVWHINVSHAWYNCT